MKNGFVEVRLQQNFKIFKFLICVFGFLFLIFYFSKALMPELPEVETIKRELKNKICGRKIKDIEVRLRKIVNVTPQEFKKRLIGKQILDVKRRAKLLMIELSGDERLLIHLKLTGQLIYERPRGASLRGRQEIRDKKQEMRGKHTHVIFYFEKGKMLLYNDLRQFGYIKLLKRDEALRVIEKMKFGPEPLDKKFTLEIFKEGLFKKARQKIKPLLMDQSFLAGLGNVYASEVCFYAEVNPQRTGSSLKDGEIGKIYEGIKEILQEAIKYKGSSVDTYLDIYGRKGGYMPHLKVYGREGKKCLRCGVKIKVIKLGGRSTYFCPKCQE
ncbi:formamidopyrimidine-DNA glycosylase [Candidatus Kuenenbacteria bacterium CG08_land_8_20_14_0_20_37_23]|uniref:Formamidopyrimidine-DNA glycosylase n=1 Tax=Candidatus Kuenenbacteria bacterium CG08_land_8_20_14_0_20_37_23 TaxID=1974617 RepID=A0A2M6XT73_9BACT|nr:MAG: formamidopyrimidine-DNA glycosylase [Candidatus Kuenenbacteria bacterium CG08_land_8_20_14_0_20_37_23]